MPRSRFCLVKLTFFDTSRKFHSVGVHFTFRRSFLFLSKKLLFSVKKYDVQNRFLNLPESWPLRNSTRKRLQAFAQKAIMLLPEKMSNFFHLIWRKKFPDFSPDFWQKTRVFWDLDSVSLTCNDSSQDWFRSKLGVYKILWFINTTTFSFETVLPVNFGFLQPKRFAKIC